MIVRIRATGQVVDMIPSSALPRLKSGEAEIVEEKRHLGARVGLWAETAAKFLRVK